MAKLILYIFFVPLIVVSMDSVNINGIFKKGQSNYYQARLIYLFIIVSLSYLVVNFIIDVLGVFS
jgi:uncharacterized membrane protein YwzB